MYVRSGKVEGGASAESSRHTHSYREKESLQEKIAFSLVPKVATARSGTRSEVDPDSGGMRKWGGGWRGEGNDIGDNQGCDANLRDTCGS